MLRIHRPDGPDLLRRRDPSAQRSHTGHVDADRSVRARALLDGGTDGLPAGLGPCMRWRCPVLEVDYSEDRELHLRGRGPTLVPDGSSADSCLSRWCAAGAIAPARPSSAAPTDPIEHAEPPTYLTHRVEETCRR